MLIPIGSGCRDPLLGQTFQSFGLLSVAMTLIKTSSSLGSLGILLLVYVGGQQIARTYGISTSLSSAFRGPPVRKSSFILIGGCNWEKFLANAKNGVLAKPTTRSREW